METLEQIANDIAAICKERPNNWHEWPDGNTYYTNAAIEYGEIWTFYLDKDSTSIENENFILFICNANDEPFYIGPVNWGAGKVALLADIAEEIHDDYVRRK